MSSKAQVIKMLAEEVVSARAIVAQAETQLARAEAQVAETKEVLDTLIDSFDEWDSDMVALILLEADKEQPPDGHTMTIKARGPGLGSAIDANLQFVLHGASAKSGDLLVSSGSVNTKAPSQPQWKRSKQTSVKVMPERLGGIDVSWGEDEK